MTSEREQQVAFSNARNPIQLREGRGMRITGDAARTPRAEQVVRANSQCMAA